jgi:hypothetical protein
MEGPLRLNLGEARILEQATQHEEVEAPTRSMRSPKRRSFNELWGLELTFYFLSMAALTLLLYAWSKAWFASGTPFLIFTLLLGRPEDLFKHPPFLAMVMLAIHASYLICSTSWLLIRLYKAVCYPAIFIIAIIRLPRLQIMLREAVRPLFASSFHFYGDTIAFFGLPALEIDDGDVPCLLNIRGVTFHLKTCTFHVTGIEVGVKINDDLEIGIQTDTFIWRVGRGIEIGDVYGSVKGPFSEKRHIERDFAQDHEQAQRDITKGRPPIPMRHASASAIAHEVRAKEQYEATLTKIDIEDLTHRARRFHKDTPADANQMHALIGSYIHGFESVPNPPKKSIKSSTLKKALFSRMVRAAVQKIPVLLRLFLNPVAHNHPVVFKSITLTGAGLYINQMLEHKLYKHYIEENHSLEKIKKDVEAFLTDGKFSIVLEGVLGIASVPLITKYDIVTFVKTPIIHVIKAGPRANSDDETLVNGHSEREEALTVAAVSGVAATFTIPSYLLPFHEHLLPEQPANAGEEDVALINMSILASLPATFDEAMNDFALALLKSSQVVEFHYSLIVLTR